MLVTNPRTEWRQRPTTDAAAPRLTWELVSVIQADLQTAYQVQCGSAPGASDLWDSGKVASSVQLATYAGVPLVSRKHVYWQVRVWDAFGKSSQWAAAEFEMGLLKSSDWGSAVWVGYQTGAGVGGGYPSPHVRKTFTTQSKTIGRGRLYASALGVYRPYVNGQRIGQDELAPGWTTYGVRRHYQTYDVTSLLISGSPNAIGLKLGDGWFLGSMSTLGRNYYASDVPRGLCALYIDYSDGASDLIVSDSSWKAASAGNRGNDIYNGSTHDARRDSAFAAPAISDSSWASVSTLALGSVPLIVQPNPPIKRQEVLTPVAVTSPVAGTYIFDFGQNHSGIPRLNLSGMSAGTVVTMQGGEDLQKSGNGQLYTAGLRSAIQTDTYTCLGAATEVYEPLHTYHGFRYLAVTGLPGAPALTTVTSSVIHADTRPTATFLCSSSLLTSIWNNAHWSHRSTAMSVIQDCNQRDERLGWTADAQLFTRSALFLRDNIALYSKYADDVDDSQLGGLYGDVAPYLTQVGRGNAGWADAGVIIPWLLYQQTGDVSILQRHYSAMKACLSALPWTSNSYGDYLNVNDVTDPAAFKAAWSAYTAGLIQKIATVLGDAATATSAGSVVSAQTSAFQARYAGGYVTSQAGLVLGLAFGLIAAGSVSAAVSSLVTKLNASGPTVGFVGLKYLFDALADNGQLALAYSIAQRTADPSWGYEINTLGMTTTGERWNPRANQGSGGTTVGDDAESYNHPIRGCIVEWLMRDVAGIDWDPASPGWANAILRPRPGGGVTWAEGGFNSPRGRFESKWALNPNQGNIAWHVAVPPNATATLSLPAGYTTAKVSGQPITSIAGVSSLPADPITGGTRFSVPSGAYDISLTA